MESFDTHPPQEASRIPYEIVRCKAGKIVSFYCLSDRPYVVGTHWNGSRAVRHPRENCPFCASGKEIRWRGYVFGCADHLSPVYIFEYTGGVGYEIGQFWTKEGTLRGARILLKRRGKAKNSPMVVQLGNEFMRSDKLPDVPDLAPFLCRIYDVASKQDLIEAQGQDTIAMNRRHA